MYPLGILPFAPSVPVVPHTCCDKLKERNIPDLSWQSPLVPETTSTDGFCSDTVWTDQVRKAVYHPVIPTDSRIIFSTDAIRRVISNIACPGHNLDVSISVIVALETCLCPKSYLIGCWIQASVIALFFTLIFCPFSQPCHPHTRSILSCSSCYQLLFTLLSCYQPAIAPWLSRTLHELMTIPFTLFLFFIHTLSFDEMRTW